MTNEYLAERMLTLIMIGLQYIRTLNGMSKTDLANKLGVARQNVHQWETQQRKISPKYLPKISALLKLPEEYYQKELTTADEVSIQESIYIKNALQLEGIPSKEEAPLAIQMQWDDFIDYQKGRYSSLFAEMLKGVNSFTKLASLSEAPDEKKNEAAHYLQFLYTDFIIFVNAIASGESYPDQQVLNILSNSINRFIESARELNIPYEKLPQEKDDKQK